MIRLSSIIATFETEFLAQYRHDLLPGHRRALHAMKYCRTVLSPKMQVQCLHCDQQRLVPHSCGHRHCPHCQHHESQQWLERQLKQHVPGEYFLLTFTLPAEFRSVAWRHQRTVYGAMMQCSWDTLRTFSQNDKHLQGTPGAVAVLHTHSRRLEFHPHVHVVMPAAAIDADKRLWRTKPSKAKSVYLFNHKALAKMFRAKILHALSQAGLSLPERYPDKWVVDCKAVGSGEKALVYLGRYLYRGVIRYQDSASGQFETRTVRGTTFLWLVLQHILPKGLRRARNFGFLHPNSKRLIRLLHYLLKLHPDRLLAWIRQRPSLLCSCCGGPMKIVRTRIASPTPVGRRPPDAITAVACM